MTDLATAPMALFYASELPRDELLVLVTYTARAEVPTPLDVITFPSGGGVVDRELAVPALVGMDEVVVDAAAMVLRGRDGTASTDAWSHTRRADGHLIALERPGRLVSVVVDAPDPALLPPNEHLVLRSATPEGGGWTAGPPIFAWPAFEVGPMYEDSLTGMTTAPETGGRLRISVPPTTGQAWFLLWAMGDDPGGLTDLGIDTTVHTVTVAPSPEGVSLLLRGDPDLAGPGAGDVLLWSHAAPVLADEGALAVDLTPMARKRLSDRLAAIRDEADPPPTLALPLRFQATSAGEIAVEERSLTVSYTVRATGPGPMRSTLRGTWTTIPLRAPAQVRPREGRWSLTARHLGRELNGPPAAAPVPATGGLLVTAGRWAAVALEVAPGPAGAGTPVVLTALHSRLGAATAAEVVFELRADVAGRPGDALVAPAVTNLAAGTDDPVMVDLGAGARLQPGTQVWVSARANQGEVRWWGDGNPSATARVSTDRGASWHRVDPRMAPLQVPGVRLFHAVDRPVPPALLLRVGGTPLEPVLLVPVGDDPLELAATGSVPMPLLDELGRRTGTGSVMTTLDVCSSAVLDLTVADFTLTYDPGAGPTPT